MTVARDDTRGGGGQHAREREREWKSEKKVIGRANKILGHAKCFKIKLFFFPKTKRIEVHPLLN